MRIKAASLLVLAVVLQSLAMTAPGFSCPQGYRPCGSVCCP